MINLYTDQYSDPKTNAQRNLSGRTHYVDDNTLRYHKSRILETYITDGGLLFAIIESCSSDFENRSRVFRPVIFDVFGNVVDRPQLSDGYKTRKQAVSAMWDSLNALDAIKLTEAAIERYMSNCAREVEYLRDGIAKLSDKVA